MSKELFNLVDLEARAREVLPPAQFDFFAGGAEDEVTLRLNRTAFERVLLRPRYLRDVSQRDLSTQVLGQSVSFPVLLAPAGYQRLAHPQGELAAARAAARMGTIMVASTVTSYTLEEIRCAAPASPLWFQLYCYRDRRVSEWLIRRAEAAGYRALCLTIDMPVLGKRERDLRNGFNLLELEVPNLAIAATTGVPPPLTIEEVLAYQTAHFDPCLTWDFVDWVRSLTAMPLIIKGIMTGEDARLAVEHGAAGIVVSNHGGRQLDGVPASLDVLAEVTAAVGGRAEVLLDSGVRRGTDVLKALALGAKAVLIGRPFLFGLALGGEAGVCRILEILREEYGTALALVGLRATSDVNHQAIHG